MVNCQLTLFVEGSPIPFLNLKLTLTIIRPATETRPFILFLPGHENQKVIQKFMQAETICKKYMT